MHLRHCTVICDNYGLYNFKMAAIETNNWLKRYCIFYKDVPVTIEFAELQDKLENSRDLRVIHGGILNDSSKKLKNIKEREHPFLQDPMRKLKQYVAKTGYRILDLFKSLDKDQSMSVSIHEFRDGIQVKLVIFIIIVELMAWYRYIKL